MLPDPKLVRIVKRLEFLLRHAWRSRHVITAKCGEVKFEFASDNLLAESIYANAFERCERVILSHLVGKGDFVVDVGANIGFYTCLFGRRVGACGKVLAFEPTPNAYEQLLRNVRLNGLDRIVNSHRVALSSSPGSLTLNNFTEGNEAYNSAGVTHAFGAVSSSDTLLVSADTLDRVLAEFLKVQEVVEHNWLIKVDVEGFERAVLEGGVQHLKSLSKISLMVELCEFLARQCGTSAKDSMALMRSLGFAPYSIWAGSRLVPFTDSLLGIVDEQSINVFFLKPHTERLLQQRGVIVASSRLSR